MSTWRFAPRLGLAGRRCGRRAPAWVWLEDAVEDMLQPGFGVQDAKTISRKLNSLHLNYFPTSSTPSPSWSTSPTASSSQTQAGARLPQRLPAKAKPGANFHIGVGTPHTPEHDLAFLDFRKPTLFYSTLPTDGLEPKDWHTNGDNT